MKYIILLLPLFLPSDIPHKEYQYITNLNLIIEKTNISNAPNEPNEPNEPDDIEVVDFESCESHKGLGPLIPKYDPEFDGTNLFAIKGKSDLVILINSSTAFCINDQYLIDTYADNMISTKNITDMRFLFNNIDVEHSIKKWDVSNVTNMTSMFLDSKNFNGDISNWDVSSVIYMNNMFQRAESFNGNISNWDVSNVNHMTSMFNHAYSFNSDISNWDVSSVSYMSNMFFGAKNFNINISKWDVSNIIYISYMFLDAESMNQDLSAWCVEHLSHPYGFSNSTHWTKPQPKWGEPCH